MDGIRRCPDVPPTPLLDRLREVEDRCAELEVRTSQMAECIRQYRQALLHIKQQTTDTWAETKARDVLQEVRW